MTDLAAKLDPIIAECLDAGLPLKQALKAIDDRFVQVAIARAGGNVTVAAQFLGVHRNSIYHRAKPRSQQERRLRNRLRGIQKEAAAIQKEIERRRAQEKA